MLLVALHAGCLRAASVRLALAMMLGLIVVSGYVVTPLLFAKLATSAEAGKLAGELFHMVNIGTLILAAAVAGFWARIKGLGRLNWSMLIAVVILLALNEFILFPKLAEIKAQIGPIDQLAVDDVRRVEFGTLHGVSAAFHLLAAVASTILVMLGGDRRGSCKKS